MKKGRLAPGIMAITTVINPTMVIAVKTPPMIVIIPTNPIHPLSCCSFTLSELIILAVLILHF
jgi:hypothetical protein